jgi:hypothetical protein
MTELSSPQIRIDPTRTQRNKDEFLRSKPTPCQIMFSDSHPEAYLLMMVLQGSKVDCSLGSRVA